MDFRTALRMPEIRAVENHPARMEERERRKWRGPCKETRLTWHRVGREGAERCLSSGRAEGMKMRDVALVDSTGLGVSWM